LVVVYFSYIRFVIQLQKFSKYAKKNQSLEQSARQNNYHSLRWGGWCQDTINESVTPKELNFSPELVNGTLHFSSIEVYDNLFKTL
jgi:hypothetical protein